MLAVAPAFAADITAVRAWRAPDNVRLVLDLSGPVQYQVSPDSTPARLILDLEGARLSGPLALPAAQAPLRSVRFEPTARGQRLVIETALELMPKIFQLPPNEKYGQRLVLDLYEKAPVAAVKAPEPGGPAMSALPDKGLPLARPADKAGAVAVPGPGASASAGEGRAGPADAARPPLPADQGAADMPPAAPGVPPAGTDKAAPPPPGEKAAAADKPPVPALPVKPDPDKGALRPRPDAGPEPVVPEKYDARRFRNIVVAIDAGHGGEDPGAIGQAGSYEKHVTLAIAKDLQARLEAEPGITAVLTRTGDYFLPLQERRRLARYQHKADIFVSIHADSAENRAARGASVFALSLKGAGSATSRFARMLAERENRADLIGGANLENEDNVLRNVLADMVVAGSLEHSLHMGRNILQGMERIARLHSPRVEQAGFAVLKEPGMVSLLVETGFISNPDEEKKLTSRAYQQDLANVIASGVRRYCVQYPVPATYFAWLADRDRGRIADARAPRRPPARAGEPAMPAAGNEPGAGAALLVSERGREAPALADTPRVVRHRVVRGDSLTRLAAQYGVPMARLREANRLRDDNIQIGQTLKIPVN
ncbi:MAG: N-acetylmuramoyl-L-alanine amidase [Pseudomonadota bacterium]